MPEDMVSFDEAMKQLQFTEEELQKLVTSGALRAFRSGGEMKFRAGDLDAVKKERETEPTIIIPAAGGDDFADETVVGVGDELQVEMPDDLIVDESAQTVVGAGGDEMGAPTVAIPEDGGTEELVFDDKELEVLPLEEEAAGTQAAEAATIVEDAGADITVAEDAGYEDEEADSRPPSSRRRVLSSRIGPAASRRKSAAFEVRRGNPIMSIVLVLSAAVALFALSIFGTILVKGYRIGVGTPSEATYVPGFLRQFYDDEKDGGWDLKRMGEK